MSSVGGRLLSTNSDPTGQSAKCTEDPVSPLWIESGMKGDTGAISLQTINKTSCRVCWQDLLSELSPSSQSRLLDLLTYQFERSLTTNASSSLPPLWKSQATKWLWYSSDIEATLDRIQRSNGLLSETGTYDSSFSGSKPSRAA